jgi:hypothetical protein
MKGRDFVSRSSALDLWRSSKCVIGFGRENSWFVVSKSISIG